MKLDSAFDLGSAAYDANALQKLRNQAASSTPQAIKAVARQVEGVFVQMMLKSMRAAIPKGGLLDSSQADMYTSMYDQQVAQQLTGKGLGLADQMVRQLSRFTPAADGAAPSGTDKPAVPAAADKPTAADIPLRVGQDAVLTPLAPPPMWSGFSRHNDDPSYPDGDDDGQDSSAVSRHFTDRLSVPAMVASRQSGISHHLILAQAALESDWGRREIPTADGKPSYNLFGIKATGDWRGKTTTVTTTEYQNGQPIKVQQRFRVYDSYVDAINDYIHLLTENPRYRGVVSASRPEAAAYALQRAGYATDPDYGAKLVQIIGQLKNAARHVVTAYTHDLGNLF
ncbi:flagellar assembly peptidoglycan hydrolase FlgJ [Martelella alba]|uniref:Peptidoglycan hydrolase FlgJ n=1 Tax=Martelella alba TaxID=2590451 RepID=A0ABY2SRA7_9HYPH|nr:flagellar assembly peptidoglycan hydrolase FlgJ [Martelella alba]TKI08292.1 flagellar assembly peptidoglycan hydrolase FlgJ [Martelella alba]